MAEGATTTRPARSRAANRSTAASKPAAVKAAPKAAAKEPETVTRFQIELEHAGTTKSYEKFAVPDSYKGTVVGNIYAPPGTARVAILIIGADDKGE